MANDSVAIPGPVFWGLENATLSPQPDPPQYMHVEVYGVTNRPLVTLDRTGRFYDAQLPKLPSALGGPSSVKYYVADVELTGSEGNWHSQGGPADLREISQSEFDAAVKRDVSKPGLNQGKLGLYI